MSSKLKRYSPQEERWNFITHAAGVILASAGGIPLFFLGLRAGDKLFSAGLFFYWLSLLVMFGASSFYHFTDSLWLKLHARKIDHCSIYLLITGTYAPLMLGAVKNLTGNVILISLIILTLLGISGKFFLPEKFHRLEVIIYLAMGWMCVIVAGKLINSMSHTGLVLLLAGGLMYSGGVIFYVIKKEFFHMIWHIFVLLGAILQYLSILTIA